MTAPLFGHEQILAVLRDRAEELSRQGVPRDPVASGTSGARAIGGEPARTGQVLMVPAPASGVGWP